MRDEEGGYSFFSGGVKSDDGGGFFPCVRGF